MQEWKKRTTVEIFLQEKEKMSLCSKENRFFENRFFKLLLENRITKLVVKRQLAGSTVDSSYVFDVVSRNILACKTSLHIDLDTNIVS